MVKKNKKINIGIIGVGDIAQHHLRVLSTFEDVNLIAVANRSPKKSTDAQKKYKIKSRYADFREMLKKETLDGVYVCVSADNMFKVSRECLKYNIPLFLEKPPSLTLTEVKKLALLAKQKKIPVMVGLNRRFYSVIQKAKKEILKKGPILGIAIEMPERINEVGKLKKLSKKTVGNWFVVGGIHGVDLMRYIGGDIQDVKATHRAYKEQNGDNFGALITFKNRAIGSYRSHWQSPGRWSIDIYGVGIRAHLEPIEEGVIVENNKKPRSIEPNSIDKKHKPGFYLQNRYFIDRLKDKKVIEYPACSIEESVKTMELIEKIGRSK
jgi:predicted dehydrogenase